MGCWADGRDSRELGSSLSGTSPTERQCEHMWDCRVCKTSWELAPEAECLGLLIWNFYFSHSLYSYAPGSLFSSRNSSHRSWKYCCGRLRLSLGMIFCYRKLPPARVCLLPGHGLELTLPDTLIRGIKGPKHGGSSQLQTSLWDPWGLSLCQICLPHHPASSSRMNFSIHFLHPILCLRVPL